MTPRISHVRVLPLLAAAVVATAVAQGCTVEPIAPLPNPGDGGTWTGRNGDSASSTGGGSGSSGSGGVFGDANACQPGSVQTFQPSAYRPATAAGQGACAPSSVYDPIQGFYDKCLGSNATNSQCAEFTADNAACASCILTPDSADHYGPLIDHNGFVTGNVAGCIELTFPSALSCAKTVQALSECELASCEANCPVTDAVSLGSYNACISQADSSGCLTFAGQADSCSAPLADAGANAIPCFAPDFHTFYFGVVPLFCGSPQPLQLDAGSPYPPPHGDDASAD
jgi:hypothetical protein